MKIMIIMTFWFIHRIESTGGWEFRELLVLNSRITNHLSIFAEYNMSYLYTSEYTESKSSGNIYEIEGKEFVIEKIKIGGTFHF